MEFKNKVVVITGGSSGIGEACAKSFLKEGAKVFIFDTQTPFFQNDNMSFIKCDISKPQEVENAVKIVCEQVKRIDHLISSAGIYLYASITDTCIKNMKEVVDVNLMGTFYILHYVLPIMKKNKFGTVVLMGSDQSIIGKANSAVYGATKGAIAQLAKSASIDYARFNIRVNCVCPGTIDTPFVREPIALFCDEKKIPEEPILKQLRDAQPIRRMGMPEEVANLSLFLSSSNAKYITGALYSIDGGYTAGVDRVHVGQEE